MRKISFLGLKASTLVLAFILLFANDSFSQAPQLSVQEPGNRDFFPAEAEIAPSVLAGTSSFQPFAPYHMWEVEFDYNASTNASGLGAMAGVCFTGTEIWVSKWNSDSILTFSTAGAYTGAFSFPSAFSSTTGGIRSLSTDGTVVYASNNTSTIHKINPTTHASMGTITAPAMTGGGTGNTGVRHCTFDPTANANAGGLWVGNWDKDIKLITLTGVQVTNIPAATHTLTGMYGSAWDGLTPGGPYLWVFDQNSGFSSTHIRQIKLPAGAPSTVFHDVLTDVATNVSGLAGGLCFVPGTGFGLNTNLLIGIVQGSLLSGTVANHLFAYSAKFPTTIDANMALGVPGFGISKIPGVHAGPMAMGGRVFNYGMTAITSASMNIDVRQGGSSVFTNTQSSANLASLTGINLFSTNFTPSTTPGTVYNVNYICSTGAQVDSFPGNDTLRNNFTITDSTFAHDDGVFATTGYRSGAEGYVITTFPALVNDSISSVWVSFFRENAGELIHAAVFNVDGNGVPVFPPAAMSPPQTLNGSGTYTFVFPGGVAIPGGANFGIGIYEVTAPASPTLPTSIHQSYNNNIGGMNFVYNNSTGSTNPSGITSSRAIRANVGVPTMVGIVKSLPEGSSLSLSPNPGNGQFSVDLKLDQSRKFEISVSNAVGQVVKTWAGMETSHYRENFDLSSYPAGVYYFQLKGNDFNETRKLMVIH